jgi:hypothetical protein
MHVPANNQYHSLLAEDQTLIYVQTDVRTETGSKKIPEKYSRWSNSGILFD